MRCMFHRYEQNKNKRRDDGCGGSAGGDCCNGVYDVCECVCHFVIGAKGIPPN